MSHARDIAREAPDVLYVIHNGDSYRIYWSQKHASNWIDKQKAAGKTVQLMEYKPTQKAGEV